MRWHLAAIIAASVASSAAAQSVWIGYTPTDLAIGDVTGDGHGDVVACSRVNDRVTIVRNAGFYGSPDVEHLATGLGPQEITLADLDGDGALDVLTRNQGDLTIHFHDDAGWTRLDLPGSSDLPLAVGDVDADGWPDILQDDRWFRGLGNRSFAAPVSLGLPPERHVVGAADLDGDGQATVIVVRAWPADEGRLDYELRELLRSPDGSWIEAPVSHWIRGQKHTPRIFPIDLERDGVQDWLVEDSAAVEFVIFGPDAAGAFDEIVRVAYLDAPGNEFADRYFIFRAAAMDSATTLGNRSVVIDKGSSPGSASVRRFAAEPGAASGPPLGLAFGPFLESTCYATGRLSPDAADDFVYAETGSRAGFLFFVLIDEDGELAPSDLELETPWPTGLEAGVPSEPVTVRLTDGFGASVASELSLSGPLVAAAGIRTIPEKVVTGPDGRATFRLVASSPHASAFLHVVAKSGVSVGGMTEVVPLVVIQPFSGHHQVTDLVQGITEPVRFLVRGPDGEPFEGATVQCQVYGAEFADGGVIKTVASDENGLATVELVETEPGWVTVSAAWVGTGESVLAEGIMVRGITLEVLEEPSPTLRIRLEHELVFGHVLVTVDQPLPPPGTAGSVFGPLFSSYGDPGPYLIVDDSTMLPGLLGAGAISDFHFDVPLAVLELGPDPWVIQAVLTDLGLPTYEEFWVMLPVTFSP
ncbi:MAG: VCBS repeat-containing protein [Planctomycetota bacterium]